MKPSICNFFKGTWSQKRNMNYFKITINQLFRNLTENNSFEQNLPDWYDETFMTYTRPNLAKKIPNRAQKYSGLSRHVCGTDTY